ncbi:hypothetical protein AgCh_009673 [Apium graveolens]
MQVSLNYLISRRASELDILINKVRVVIHEDTLLLAELKNAQVATFPEAYLQPSNWKQWWRKEGDEKKDGESKRRGERRSKQRHDDSEPQQTLKIQTQLAQPLAQSSKSTISTIKPPQTSKPKFLYRQTANSLLKIPITTSQTSLKKISTLPSVKPSHKTYFKSVGRNPKKAKPTEKVEITERAIWNCFKQNDFLPLNWCSSDEDYFQQLAEEIVKVWVVTLKEDKDTATRAWRSVLAEWLVAREERKARSKSEYEEKRRKYDEETEIIKPKNSIWKKIKKIMPQKSYEEAWS